MKRIVYKILKSAKKQNSHEGYEIYSDGSIQTPAIFGDILDFDREFHKEFDNFVNENINFKKHYGHPPVGYNNCPLTEQEGDEEAFYTLCLLLNDLPPFKGYRIKYYGEGEPWIPNPDYIPDAIID